MKVIIDATVVYNITLTIFKLYDKGSFLSVPLTNALISINDINHATDIKTKVNAV